MRGWTERIDAQRVARVWWAAEQSYVQPGADAQMNRVCAAWG
ncbi:hypothetical protein [Paenibacillus sp. MMS18-CY102]|nr:hypothetical protein [Paenibacillus sp. MMS18-CY102]